MKRNKKCKTISARVTTHNHSDSGSESEDLAEPFHKSPPECPKKPAHFSHINISTSNSLISRVSHHAATFKDSDDSDEERPHLPIPSIPSSSLSLQNTPVMIHTCIATTLSFVSYSFWDLGQKASQGKPLAGEDLDAEEEDSQGLNKDRSQNQLAEWHPELDTYIQEMLQLEGCGLFTSRTQCSCGRDFEVDRINNLHCCCDCYMPELFCKDCMVNHHAYMPFHRLERWNSQFFEHCTLKNCGLILELGGHTKDKPCLMVSIASLENLTVVNKCGIQDITVCYCSCHHAGAQREQLLHARLWPATITNPKTAVTFDCLEHFQMLNLMTKTSGSEFYETLERLTDNTGMRVPASRLREFMRASQQLQTVSCPYPNVNLPLDYESTHPSKSFIYKLFTAQDANMKCTRLNASSEERDPGSNQGAAFFVHQPDFMAHVNEFDKKLPPTKPTCNNHKAIRESNDTIAFDLGLHVIYVMANSQPRLCLVEVFAVQVT
ncbi:hypothetical protein BT96DRAFT_1008551 [Gymnopus androsaceus JB14]|uniref:CxC2-like cysteine cluster KDZ transposase-associated domain-containing protein n=1 Tax=Gymnopus androsaceus JB14 TaxID=1447944 RepID=A0A6A4GEI8_9AGAR|nr:hypothetical protein BT96DRAFT_1008551 [Gymnopus androsaceus JB14]